MKLKYMCNMQHLHARIVVCLLTLKKAFDTFDHNILLDKLNFYSFHELINQWFSSYLNNWTQTTQIPDHISNKASKAPF